MTRRRGQAPVLNSLGRRSRSKRLRPKANWWETFFTGLIVDFWRAAMPPEATRAEAEFFEKSLEIRPGARLLDVPCGDGRLALELAGRGYRVTGVDISEDFLAAARESAASRTDPGGGPCGPPTPLAIEWRRSDMRDLPWREDFDGALCGGSSFGFLGDEGDLDFLEAVCRALRPGARFVIDAVKAAEVILPQFRERHEMEVGDIRFTAHNRYDHKTGWIENQYTLARGDQSEVRLARHRIYTCREIASMLERAGFDRIESFGSLSGEPFRLGSSRLIVLARRSALVRDLRPVGRTGGRLGRMRPRPPAFYDAPAVKPSGWRLATLSGPPP